jgi:hypothetical protein
MPITAGVSADGTDARQRLALDSLHISRCVRPATAVRVQSIRAKVLKGRGTTRNCLGLEEDPLSDSLRRTAPLNRLLLGGRWHLSLLRLPYASYSGKAL